MKSRRAQYYCGIVVLLLLQPAAAQETMVPACPITEPVFRYNYTSTGGALPDIPSSGNAVIILDGSNGTLNKYFFTSEQTVASAQIICIVTSIGNMATLETAVAGRHVVLQAGGWLHLENLYVNRGSAAPGGVSAAPPYGDRKLTTNNVQFQYCQDSAIHATTALTAHLHDTTFRYNSGQNTNGAGIFMLETDAGGGDTAFLKLTGHCVLANNYIYSAARGAGLGAAMYLGSHTTAAQARVQVVFATSALYIYSNNAKAGGAIFVDGGVDLRFQGRGTCSFWSNEVYGGGNLPANTDALGGALMVMNTDPSKPALSYVELGCEATTIYNNKAIALLNAAVQAGGAALYVAAPMAGDKVVVDFPGRTTTAITNNGVVLPGSNSTGGAVSIHSAGEVRVNAKGCLQFADNSRDDLGAPNPKIGLEGLDIGITTEAGGVASISVGPPTGSLRFGNASTLTSNVALAGGGSIQCGSNTPKSAGNFFFQCDMCDAACNNVATGGGTCNACGSSAPTCPSPPGCSAPPPTGSPSTLITGYSSCSAPVSSSDGTYPITTSCQATCQGAASGGFATCSLDAFQVPSWQLRGCQADCSGNPPAAPGVVWSCGASTFAGGSCKAACSVADGFAGGPVLALCLGPSWSSTNIGSCTRVACIGPPRETPPNATFSCTSTPVGEPCRAVCSLGLTGSLRHMCLADGSFGRLEGDPCVDCVANKPQLEAAGAAAPFPAGTTVLSATFSFTACYVQGTTKLTPKLDGQTTGCAAVPAQLNGPQVAPASITVSCQAAAGSSISAGPHTIGLTAESAGANGCSSGSLSALADVLVAVEAAPAPVVKLSAAGAAAPACKAAAGAPTTVTAEFIFAISEAAGGVQLDFSDASAAGAACTAQRTGGLERGKIRVTCRGVVSSAINSLAIRLTLKASTPGSLVGSDTSSQEVAFVCCQNTVALAINTAGDCLTCQGGTSSRVEGVWLKGELTGGVMRSGALAAASCSSAGPDVGSISAACDDGNKLLTVTVINPPGSSTTLQYMARCNPVSTTPGAACGSSWLTANARRNGLQVSKTASATITTFSISVAHSACGCRQLQYAVRQAGVVGRGACGRHRF